MENSEPEHQAARGKCSKAPVPIPDIIRKKRRCWTLHGKAPMMLRTRYRTLNLRALCWVLRWLRD